MNMEPAAIVTLVCLIAGGIISGLVSIAKKWSLVKDHPKTVAMGLSIVATIISGLTIGGLNWTELVACTLVPFSAAVATHEMAEDVKKEM